MLLKILLLYICARRKRQVYSKNNTCLLANTYSAFMEGVMCPCYFSSEPCTTTMSKTIISYGYYDKPRCEPMRNIINRIIL